MAPGSHATEDAGSNSLSFFCFSLPRVTLLTALMPLDGILFVYTEAFCTTSNIDLEMSHMLLPVTTLLTWI